MPLIAVVCTNPEEIIICVFDNSKELNEFAKKMKGLGYKVEAWRL